jgi:5-methylthioadenosine/S-adenosylhomocysteine deaminase
VIIAGGSVVTMDATDTVMNPGWVRIEGEDIVGVSDESLEPRPGEEVLDATGLAVIPGLVNTHVHCFQTLLRAVYDELPLSTYLSYIYRCGVELTGQDCEAGGVLAGIEAVRSGTTTVVDHHFLNRGNDLVEGTIAGMLRTGVRSVVARTMMDIGQGLPDAIKEPPGDALVRLDELLTEHAEERARRTLTIMGGPNTPGINASAEACIASREHAADRGIRRSAHVAEYRGVVEAVEANHGIHGPVRWLEAIGALGADLLAVHAVQVEDDEVGYLREHDVAVSHNPFSNLFCGDRNAPVDRYVEAGLRIGLGTDGAANNNGQGILDASRLTRLLQRARPDPFAISPTRGLRMATIDGARAIGLDDVIGSIEVGKRADLALVRLGASPHMVPIHDLMGHLAHFAKGTDVQTTIVGGRVLMRDRVLVQIDEGDWYDRIQRLSTALVSRLG